MPHFIGIKLANCHKKTHFQSEQKKLNVISRLDWLLMGFGYFREISFTGKKFPIYMEPLTRGYWSTDMDRSHNQCILQHFRTRCKINLTYQSQKPPKIFGYGAIYEKIPFFTDVLVRTPKKSNRLIYPQFSCHRPSQ